MSVIFIDTHASARGHRRVAIRRLVTALYVLQAWPLCHVDWDAGLTYDVWSLPRLRLRRL